MATPDKSKPVEDVPADLLPIIRKSGVLSERQFEDVKAKVLSGGYPNDSIALAQKLVREKILTDYQVKRFLQNKPHGLSVGKYVIQDRLGSGSMGRVYKALHVLMGRAVALKVIAPEIVSNQRVVQRFQREMKLVGRLDHPNVVRAFDADQVGSILYIVMEYVQGISLGQKFRMKGPLDPLEVAEYAAQAAAGLAHAHSQGIVHRDVKPSNLFLAHDGRVKVLDLGLGILLEADSASSFATADNIAVGTIDYMSPEQACGKTVDGRSDLYSLGCAMHHMITGRLPFQADTPVERLGKRINGRPTPIADLVENVPPAMSVVMSRLLANRPGDRYQSAEEAAEALKALNPRIGQSHSNNAGRSASRERAIGFPSGASQSAVIQLAPPDPEIVEVRPEYPRWFRPLAELAEDSPWGALTVVGLCLFTAFGIGFAASFFIR
jgi:serine/threonine protein kinase